MKSASKSSARVPAGLSLMLATFLTTCPLGAELRVRNAATPANNATQRANWLNDLGLTPQYRVDFESGFLDQQNLKGVTGLFPGGLVVNHSDPTAWVKVTSLSSDLGGSNPVGVFALATQELPVFSLDFSPHPVDYIAFMGIDHGASTLSVFFEGGGQANLTLDGTLASGDSAEFYGLFRNDRPPITRLEINATGAAGWGLDNLEYGVIPEPSTVLLFALGGIGLLRRRLTGG